MPTVTYNRLDKQKAYKHRNKTGTVVKAKYKPKTAAANRGLITANAEDIKAIRRLLPQPTYCDWQFGGSLFATVDPSGFQLDVLASSLMTPAAWLPKLRQDIVVARASTTRVLRLQANMRYTLGGSNYAQISVFVVSFRPQAANRTIASLTNGDDYILSVTQDMNARLNPAVLKTHFARNISLTAAGWLQQPFTNVGGDRLEPDPNTTFKKGQINLDLDLDIRQPEGTAPWKDMTSDQLPPSQRYYLLAFINSEGTNSLAQSGCRIDYDILYTTKNMS